MVSHPEDVLTIIDTAAAAVLVAPLAPSRRARKEIGIGEPVMKDAAYTRPVAEYSIDGNCKGGSL